MYRLSYTNNRTGKSWVAPSVYTDLKYAKAYAKRETKDEITATVVETNETSPMAEITPLGYKYLDGEVIE